MGCSSSKLDDLPAVALCRERCTFLDEAIQQRFALAEAHLAYTASLKLFGQSLNNFIEHDFGISSGPALSPSPPSPDKLKSKAVDPIEVGSSSPKKGHHHSHSNSGSHLHFHSDSDDDDSGGSLHHSDHSSPLHDDGEGHIEYMPQNYPNYGPGSFPGGFMHMNFMKKQPTPSIVYEQRPMNPETVYMGESSPSSSYYPYSYLSNNNPNSSSYPYPGYPNYGGFSNYSSYSAPGYGSSLQPSSMAAGSSSKPPPPPPSPPRASAWDFLNPFASFENYYPPYTPSRDSREVREEEGIPELEDEDFQHEVVKEVHVDQKFVDSGSYSKSPVEDEGGKVTTSEPEASLYQARPSVGIENDRVEYEVHVVDKKVVDDERAKERGTGSRGAPRDVFEVIREIQVQFVRASESGTELAKLLEVGTLPYQRKHVSKMLHVVTPLSVVKSQPSTSKTGESSSSADSTDPAFLDFNDELARKPKNLSSTLQKLYLWEKKLYNEVKAEEKMRVTYDRKSHNLKRLDQRGAEANKIDSTRNSIRSLSTKIRIAIQVVDKISVTINKIRDEELWPLLNELIEGLNRMWKSMLECHRSQCEVIREAKTLGLVGSSKKLSDDRLKATLQLEHELISWTIRFSSWIRAQKGYVRGLNNWLLKCLYYEPEVTDDGIAPFSPSRVGAPPIFVICNQWSQAMDRISEREVIDSMSALTMSVLQLWEQDKSEMHRRMMANKDLERKARSLDREDQKLQKEIQALDKKIVLASGDGNNLSVAGNVVYQSETSNRSLQGSLQRIFEAMEKFSSESSKAYDELLQRVKERIAQEHERVS
ncbi:hypothetical protein like AT4G35240 [Hibiscus trionum]|uniref:Uncharacterized protein n=1 Tax=Hibiscus trionum TaxID=183268 RepID=A0A9W7H9C7_HIBTR|nr:hypothetical protein like AT4G35240 [Hibiscus trionum]